MACAHHGQPFSMINRAVMLPILHDKIQGALEAFRQSYLCVSTGEGGPQPCAFNHLTFDVRSAERRGEGAVSACVEC